MRRISHKLKYCFFKILIFSHYKSKARRNKMRFSLYILNYDNVSKRSSKDLRDCENNIFNML